MAVRQKPQKPYDANYVRKYDGKKVRNNFSRTDPFDGLICLGHAPAQDIVGGGLGRLPQQRNAVEQQANQNHQAPEHAQSLSNATDSNKHRLQCLKTLAIHQFI